MNKNSTIFEKKNFLTFLTTIQVKLSVYIKSFFLELNKFEKLLSLSHIGGSRVQIEVYLNLVGLISFETSYMQKLLSGHLLGKWVGIKYAQRDTFARRHFCTG